MTPYLPANLGFMPLIGVMTFLISTIALFFLGPFDWPIRNHESLALFLIGAMVTISSGYTMGVTAPSRTGELTYWRQLYVLGALSSCILILPSAYVYTGKMPWEAFDALFDQGQAYRDFLARITELDGQRGPVVLARTLTHWMIYAVIPIAVFRWRRLNLVMRLLLAGTIVSAACFSLLRGTDQGTFDLVYIFAASMCVVIARSCLRSGRTIGSLLTSGVGMATIGLAVVMIAAALYVFTERKVGRYDGRIETLCFGEDQQICVNDRHPIAAELSEKGRFAFAMVTAYATMGYYGLALSLERDFDSTLGVGHSSALTRLY